MRIAILGAGFAGLATTWFLSHYTIGSATIDLFDPQPIGGGVSGLSSGLLHTFTGKQAKPAWHAHDCLAETHRLLTEASRTMNRSLVLAKGILRPALSEEQVKDFQLTASKYPETEWWDSSTCQKKVKGLKIPEGFGGLYIKEGLTLDVPAYLQGLWTACALHGAKFTQTAKINAPDLENYDRVLIAMGVASKNFGPLKELPIKPVKGQVLQLRWPNYLPPLPFSLNSKKYLIMGKDQKSCTVGATFEREFDTAAPTPEKAAQEIFPDILSYFPSLKDAEIVGCRAGFRATTPNHLPLVGQVSEKLFFYTGLGSKGLLYHALIGKLMARALLTGESQHLPADLIWKPKR